jgi:twitching motility protein PilI
MAERLSLREFEQQLAERLRAAPGGASSQGKLGFLAGGRQWLTDLAQINEVVTVHQLTPVPWALPWFVGMASVRGTLFGCTDFALYQGLPSTPGKGEQRLLLAHPRFGVNAALRIDRAVGLRSVRDMEAVTGAAPEEAWMLGRWRDVDGSEWTEINMEKLVTDPRFLAVGL